MSDSPRNQRRTIVLSRGCFLEQNHASVEILKTEFFQHRIENWMYENSRGYRNNSDLCKSSSDSLFPGGENWESHCFFATVPVVTFNRPVGLRRNEIVEKLAAKYRTNRHSLPFPIVKETHAKTSFRWVKWKSKVSPPPCSLLGSRCVRVIVETTN